MIAQSKVVAHRNNYTIWEFGVDRALEMTRFVYGVYFSQFASDSAWSGDEYEKILEDDIRTLGVSSIFVALSHDSAPLATIRLIERDVSQLPIERDFNVDAPVQCETSGIDYNRIYEVGRLAKSSKAIAKAGLPPDTALTLVNDLIGQVVKSSSNENGNIWFASIDEQVLQLLRGRGFGFRPVGETVGYVGSMTTPVMLPIDECRNHMKQELPENFNVFFGPDSVHTGSNLEAV